MILTEIEGVGLTEKTTQYTLNESSGRGATGAGGVELTQAQVENPASTVFGSVSGQRLSQSIVAWAATITSVFKGWLDAYREKKGLLVIASGAVSIPWATCRNTLKAPSLTQNTIFTFSGAAPFDEEKPVTLETVPDTGGPWTASYTHAGLAAPKLLIRNGAGTAARESFEFESNGTKILTPDSGGLVWSGGT